MSHPTLPGTLIGLSFIPTLSDIAALASLALPFRCFRSTLVSGCFFLLTLINSSTCFLQLSRSLTSLGALACSLRSSISPQTASSMFFRYNSALGPPYQVLVDTNFLNFSISNKLDPIDAMRSLLLAKATPCVPACVIAELEKLGPKYRIALRLARDPRFEQLPCSHPGTYADDCLVKRAEQHRCYIVATCDKELKRRVRKIPGVPIMSIQGHRVSCERREREEASLRTERACEQASKRVCEDVRGYVLTDSVVCRLFIVRDRKAAGRANRLIHLSSFGDFRHTIPNTNSVMSTIRRIHCANTVN